MYNSFKTERCFTLGKTIKKSFNDIFENIMVKAEDKNYMSMF